MVSGKLFRKSKPGLGMISLLVVFSNLHLILFVCVVPMLNHSGCPSIEGVCLLSLIVANRVYGRIAMWYMCPGSIFGCVRYMYPGLIVFFLRSYFPFSRSRAMPLFPSFWSFGKISRVISICCLLRAPFSCVVPMDKYCWLFMVTSSWCCGLLNL